MGLPGLEIEKTEHQRASEAEQRGGEGNAHAGDWRREPVFEIIEHDGGVGAGLHRLDDAADRSDGFKQAPERAEQAKKNEQAGQVAGGVARLVEPGSDRVENGAQRRRGHCSRQGLVANERRDGRQKNRRLDAPGIAAQQRIGPSDFAKQADDPAAAP